MNFPYQCLVSRRDVNDPSKWTLFGASGSQLVAQTSTGALSVWSQKNEQAIEREGDETQEPLGKRVKLSPSQDQTSNFSSLILSSNGQYLVGVTGEDKCIRVFQVSAEGLFHQLSERCMTRRPSSITLASDESTILCADKFGDVYALPLLPSPDDEQAETSVANDEPEEKDFTPSATVLTVHSGRNRRTLEEQLKQKAKGPLKTKEVMTFRHDLLLGHVSMLTDLAHAQVEGRSYILTADRDEHIRISRGVPQAHIIEGFCMGHEEFVSRLCLTPSGLLISGGGDSSLFVWDWTSRRLIERLPLRDTASEYLRAHNDADSSRLDGQEFKVAVSGIYNAPGNDSETTRIFVACEGLPALFGFDVGAAATRGTSIPLRGNALAVACVPNSQGSYTAVVSIDNIHKPGSTTELRSDGNAPRLQYFSKLDDGSWQEDSSLNQVLADFAERGHALDVEAGNGSAAAPEGKTLRDILYSVEKLRKRPGAED
ncbi:guanine-N(7)--methyltransferase subunit TRM82 [Paraphoma chrysanthemicola]|nr:guanine-N(7)--methyltransferase subunit TRM82 [Paraphoma chrysanthemicola]